MPPNPTTAETRIEELNRSQGGYPYRVPDEKREGQGDDDPRTWFEFDQSQIIYSNAFRRLAHKSQMIVRPIRDHYRSRLVHSHEVKEIASQLGDLLRLNHGLIGAITLGHDLGHTPFGHAGEKALRGIVIREANNYLDLKRPIPDYAKAFHHASNSARILAFCTGNSIETEVSLRTIRGALAHSWSPWKGSLEREYGTAIDPKPPQPPAFGVPESYEAQVSAIADQLAAINHDTEDILNARNYTNYDASRFSSELKSRIRELIPASHDQLRKDVLGFVLPVSLLSDESKHYGRKKRIEEAIQKIVEVGKPHLETHRKPTEWKQANSPGFALPSPGHYGVYLDIYERFIRGILESHSWFCGRNAMAQAMVTTAFVRIWTYLQEDIRSSNLKERLRKKTVEPEDTAARPYYNHFIKFWQANYDESEVRKHLKDECEELVNDERICTWVSYLYYWCKAHSLENKEESNIEKLECLVSVVDFIAGLTDRYCAEIFDSAHDTFSSEG